MPQNPSLSTPIGNTGISVDPSKAARTALLVARGMGRKTLDDGGSAGDPMYGGAQPTSQPGFEEWQTQTGGNIFPDSSNAVTGPTEGSDARDEVMNKYWNNVYKRRNIESTTGDEIKRGGRIKRDSGGNAGLKNAINSFSQQRNAEFNTSPASAQQEQMLLASLMNQPRELAVAEVPRESQQPPAMNTYGDLGDQIERGAKFLEGTPDEDMAPVKGQPSKGAPVNAATEQQAPNGTDSLVDRTKYGIAGVESAGQKNPYLALGRVLKNGDQAYGKYQVMASNVPSWTQEALGTPMTPEQFRQDPDAQEKTVSYQLGKILKNNGNDPRQAASIWFTGGRLENVDPNRSDGRTTNAQYQRKFLNGFNAYPGGGNQPVQSADASGYAPPSMGRPDAQGIIKDPNSDGSFTLRDANGNTVGYDRGNASLDSVPYSQPHLASGPPLPPPRPPDPSLKGEGASGGPQAQADPMSDIDPNAIPSAARGGYMRRAGGGPAYSSMPTNELIAKALDIIRRRHAATGGTQAAPTLQSLQSSYDALAKQQAQQQAQQAQINHAQGIQLTQQMGNEEQDGTRGSASDKTADTRAMMGALLDNATPPPPASTPTPAAATPNTPAVPSGQVGNQGAPTGNGIDTPPPGNDIANYGANPSPIPMAAPTPYTGNYYNNTLDQVLGTNNPTQNQIFGFNYPQNLPPPKAQPVGPVSQNEINGLYGFGGGSQMGTGTFESGGAVIMDALNRARRAIGGKTHIQRPTKGSAVKYPLAPRSEWYGDANYEQTGGKMSNMSPKDYLSRTRPMDPNEETTRDNINDLKAHIKSGRTLDPLALYPNGKEDGRHRAHAAQELGIKSVPVLSWDKNNSGN